jgi:hypothetical protein
MHGIRMLAACPSCDTSEICCQALTRRPLASANVVPRFMRRMETLWFVLQPSYVYLCLTTIQGLCVINAAKGKKYHADIVVIDGSNRKTIVKDLLIFSSKENQEHDFIQS